MALGWINYEGTVGTTPTLESAAPSNRLVSASNFRLYYAGTAPTLQTSGAFRGSVGLRLGAGTTNANLNRIYNTPAATTFGPNFVMRGYFKLTAAPVDDFGVGMFMYNAWAKVDTFGIGTNRSFFINSGADGGSRRSTTGGTVVQSAANTVPLNAWFRVEVIRHNAGQTYMRVFFDPNSTSAPDVMLSVANQDAASLMSGGSGAFAGYSTYGDYSSFSGSDYLYQDCLVQGDEAFALGPIGGSGGKTEVTDISSGNSGTVFKRYADTSNLSFHNVLPYDSTVGLCGAPIVVWASDNDTFTTWSSQSYTTAAARSQGVGVRAQSSTIGFGANLAYDIPDTTYTRAYYRLSAAPAYDVALIHAMGTDSGNTNGFASSFKLGISSDRRFYAKTEANINAGNAGSGVASAANALPLNAWVRVETMTTTTSFQMKVWYSNPDSTGVPDWDSGLQTGNIYNKVGTHVGGQSITASWVWQNFVANGTMDMADLAISDTAWVGPTNAVHNATATLSGTGTLTADMAGAAKTISAALTGTGVMSTQPNRVQTATAAPFTGVGLLTASVAGAGYPELTKTHPRPVNSDAPSSPTLGGPVVLRGLATEVEALSTDLINARAHGENGPYPTVNAALAELWDLVTTLRNQTLYGQTGRPVLMASPPTTTHGGLNAATTLTGQSSTIYPNYSAFRYGSMRTASYGALGGHSLYWGADSAYDDGAAAGQVGRLMDISFMTDAREFEFIFRGNFNDAGYVRYRYMVDGEWANGSTIQLTTSTLQQVRSKITFTSRKPRLIRVVTQGMLFGGIQLPAAASIWEPALPPKPQAVVVCDSFGSRYSYEGGTTGIWYHGSPYNLALEYLGYDVVNLSIGGTGFMNNASGASSPYVNRIPTVQAYPNTDLIMVVGSVNDANGSFTNAQVQDAVATYFGWLHALMPTKEIISLGGIPPGDEYIATMQIHNTAMSTAVNSFGGTFIDPVGWISGTGNAGSPMGNGNRDYYVSADNYHLTDEGSDYVADRLADELGTMLRRQAPIR